MKMKKAGAIIFVVVAALFLTCLDAGAAQIKQVGILDTMSFDGAALEYSFLTYSRCPASQHRASVRFSPEYKSYRGTKKVVSFTVDLFDAADSCDRPEKDIVVSAKINLYDKLKSELKNQIDKGYVIDPDYVLWLPAVRTSPMGKAADTSGATTAEPAPSAPQTVQTPDKKTPAQSKTVKVALKQYSTRWHCYLQKNDGARNDGFNGYGSTLEDARNDAASGCFRTNNPHCTAYSRHPDHTVCNVEFQDTGDVKLVDYDRDQIPKDINIERWECMLRKNDGARNDGFQGTGTTEEKARKDTISGCRSTNNPYCEQYAVDDAHTKCVAYASAQNSTPQVRWTCTLWKNDGARNDGFEGTGATENEAREDTIGGCLSTNNPYCKEYSRDPEHTKCTAEIVQQ